MKTTIVNFAPDMPRADYPRPQWARKEWYCLNGKWDFAFDFGKTGEARGMVSGGEYPMTINVPFCPESKASGIEYVDFMYSVWYRRTLAFDKLPEGRAILHFGAVDYLCKVWVNGTLCGTHSGGYTSFEFDITDALKDGENTLVVQAIDDQLSGRQARGKQCDTYGSAACDYKRTTGIYQTVWLEFVPERYLKKAQMTPHATDGTLDVRLTTVGAKRGDRVRLIARYHGKIVATSEVGICGNQASAQLRVNEIHLWNPGEPEIYDLTVELFDSVEGVVIDTVESYFALRDIALNDRALMVNGRPVFMRMLLDQGFHPDGIYTAPSDEVLKGDIERSMALGFNGARFHYRVFEDRSLYWADQLGYLVWAEHCVRELEGPQGMYDFLPEWMETIDQYYSHPCVIGWICANETYHRMVLDPEANNRIYHVTKTLDPYRPVIGASGGVHYDTDMIDIHDYEQDAEKLREDLKPMLDDDKAWHDPSPRYRGKAPLRIAEYKGQPYWVSECGGTFWHPTIENGGIWGNTGGWGYGSTPECEEEVVERFEAIVKAMVEHPRVCGYCWTQLTDVEQELNGMYYYDRSKKFSDELYERIKKVNSIVAEVEKNA